MFKQDFIPGSEWLYYKLYTGVKVADSILKNEIATIISILKKKNLIEKWFYIRYSDPDFHLRIRFKPTNNKNIGEIMTIFYQFINPLYNDNLIWKISIDTYSREMYRYDKLLINDTESLFCVDSDFSLAILKQLTLTRNEDSRWLTAILMIDSLLNDFEYGTVEKCNLLKRLNSSFKTEFGFNEFNSKQLNTIFRKKKYLIERLFDNSNHTEFKSLISTLDSRSIEIEQVAKAIKAKIVDSTKNIDDLISSYIHMMLNRHFRNKNRIYELVIYDFLRRYYESAIAKVKYLNYQQNK